MARKKKINKRAVAILIVVGVIVLIAVAAYFVDEWLPKNPLKYAQDGNKAFEAGDYQKAERLYKEAFEASHSKNAFYLYRLAQANWEMVKLQQGMVATERRERFHRAVQLLRRSVRMKPDFAEAQQLLCDIYWQSPGGLKEFIAEADKMLQIDPNRDVIYVQRAMAKAEEMAIQKTRDPELIQSVLADFNKALELKPDDIAHYMRLVLFLRRMEMDDEAEKAFEKAVSLNPDSAELRANYAMYLREVGRTDEALAQIDEAVRRDPNSTVGFKARAEHYRYTGDLDQAMKALEDALKVDDSDFLVYREKAGILLRQNKNDQAADAIRKGIQTLAAHLKQQTSPVGMRRLETATWQLHYSLAGILLERLDRNIEGDKREELLQEVRSSLGQLTKYIPERPERAKIAGLLAYSQGKLQESAVLLEKALVSGAAAFDMPAAGRLVSAYLRLGQIDRAQEILERMSRFSGEAGRAKLTLTQAELKMRARDYRGAQEKIAQVLAADSNMPEARNIKSILDVLVGDRDRLLPATKVSGPYLALLLEHAGQLISDRDIRGLLLLEDLHTKAPANKTVIARLLDIYVRGDKLDKAEAIAKEAEKDNLELAAWVRQEIAVRAEKDPQKRFELQKARIEEQIQDPLGRALSMSALCQSMNRQEDASRYLQQAAAIDANHPAVVQLIFITHLREKNWESAEEWAARAARLNLDGVDGKMFATRLAIARNDLDKAIELLEELAGINPRAKQVKVMLADCYRLKKQYDRAQALYEEVIRVDSSYAHAAIGMAMLTGALNKADEHRIWVERANQLPAGRRNEYIQKEHLSIMEARARPEELPKLIEERSKRLLRDPDDLRNAYALAVLMEKAGRLPQAEQLLRHVYDKSASKLNGARPLAAFYGRHDRQGDLVNFLSEVDGVEPDKVGLQILVGDSLGYYDAASAERAYRKGIEVNPQDRRGHLAMARFLDAHGRWKDAIQAYLAYQKLAPDSRLVPLLVIRCRLNDGQLEQAKEALRTVLAEDPTDPEALTLRGGLAVRLREHDEALKCYNLALQSNPDSLAARLGRAHLFLITGEPQKAREDLQAVRQISEQPQVNMEYANVCRSLGDTTAAEMAYLDILSRQRGYSPALRELANLYLELRNWPSLEQRLAEARKLFPKDSSFLLIKHRMWKARKDDNKAIAALEEAVQIDPDSPVVVATYLEALVDAGRYDQAVLQCDQYADKPQHKFIARVRKASALASLKRLPEAEKEFISLLTEGLPVSRMTVVAKEISKSFGPKEACARAQAWARDHRLTETQAELAMGLLYSEAGDYAAGIEAIEKVRAKAKPEDRFTLGVVVAMMYYGKKDFARAEQMYLEQLKVHPTNLQVLNNLAYLYANDLDNAAKALPYAKRALELTPGNSNVVDTYGWALTRSGRYPKGIEVLERAVAMTGSKPVFHYHLAYAYEKSGRRADAEKQCERGLKLAEQSGDDSARKLLRESLNRIRQMP